MFVYVDSHKENSQPSVDVDDGSNPDNCRRLPLRGSLSVSSAAPLHAHPYPDVTPKRSSRSIFESVALLAESSHKLSSSSRLHQLHVDADSAASGVPNPPPDSSILHTPGRLSALSLPPPPHAPFATPPYTPVTGSQLRPTTVTAPHGGRTPNGSALASPLSNVMSTTPEIRPRSSCSAEDTSDGALQTPPYTPMRFDNQDGTRRSLVLNSHSPTLRLTPHRFIPVRWQHFDVRLTYGCNLAPFRPCSC